jgi:hypothetical protein
MHPILGQINSAHTTSVYFLKIHLNIILSSMPRSHKWSLLFRFRPDMWYTGLFFMMKLRAVEKSWNCCCQSVQSLSSSRSLSNNLDQTAHRYSLPVFGMDTSTVRAGCTMVTSH